MTAVRLLGIAGCLRQKSTNRGLLRAPQQNLPEGASMEFADLAEVLFYNQDITEKPPAVRLVLAQMGSAHELVLAATRCSCRQGG